jgi:hypothetical protein
MCCGFGCLHTAKEIGSGITANHNGSKAVDLHHNPIAVLDNGLELMSLLFSQASNSISSFLRIRVQICIRAAETRAFQFPDNGAWVSGLNGVNAMVPQAAADLGVWVGLHIFGRTVGGSSSCS